MDYEVTIGIEIHCELMTKTKMFSPAPVTYDEPANTQVHQNDMAFPGTLPSLNKQGVAYALKMCTGLHMEIDPLLRFDRKNYFYSDLPKGFQITQQRYPIGRHGYLMIEVDGEFKRIDITRLHMEEDTAKQYHDDTSTLIDFNRAGIGLIEIVSEPQLHSGVEAAAYVTSLRQIVLALGISDAKMEEGSLRCDVNISLAPKGSKQLGTKVEIKNLNSINNIQRAIEKEIEIQSQLLDEGKTIDSCTKRFDEALKTTVLMRKKETVVDYRYFPEPNIPPILLDPAWMDEVTSNLPELPYVRLQRYLDLGLSLVDSNIFINNLDVASFYDRLLELGAKALPAANFTLSEVLGLVNLRPVAEVFEAKEIVDLLGRLDQKELSSKQAKVVLKDLVDKKMTVADSVAKNNLVMVSDEGQIIAWIEDVLANHPQAIEDYRAGKDKAAKFVMGQVMKLSRGQVNPALANRLVEDALKKHCE